MNILTMKTGAIATILSASLMTLAALPVYAETAAGTNISVGGSADASVGGASVGANADVKIQARITTAKGRADQEIDRRITALNELNTRVQAMTRVSSDGKNAVATEVASQTSVLSNLKTKIDADTDITTLKADIKSITASYRVFMLIIPQGRIEVAADKIGTVVATMTTFAGKLQTRISDAQTAGKDVAALSASLSDMNAKLADASAQASAAVSLVASLTPDNGDKTKETANNQAIKDARGKIKAALQDLKTAREDARSIVSGLKAMGGASASASSSASTQ